MPSHEVNQLGTWEPWMGFNLIVRHRDFLTGRDDLLQLIDIEVGHSYGTYFPRP